MKTIKSLLTVALFAVATAPAYATTFNITGTLDNAGTPYFTSLLQPFGVTTATASNVNVPVALLASTLDITGTSITGGSLKLSNYGIKIRDTSGNVAAANFSGVQYDFNLTGFTGSNTGAVAGSCTGGWYDACVGSYAGTTPFNYTLFSTGADTYQLTLRVKGNVGQVVTENFLLVASPVPVPAAAWLFGSGIVGLAGMAARRNKQ
jgi:hypothetical protein